MNKCPKCFLSENSSLDVYRYFWPQVDFNINFFPDQACSFCQDSERYYLPERLTEERELFFSTREGPLFLAYSGGKDSTSSLIYLREIMKIPIIAVLYDNGFIPGVVKEFAENLCKKLAVEFHILKESDFKNSKLRKGFLRCFKAQFNGPRNDACGTCSRILMNRIQELMLEQGANSLITGENFWSHSPHTSIEKAPPYMEAVLETTYNKQVIRILKFPFSIGLTYQESMKLLKRFGFHNLKFSGYTSNCYLSDFQDFMREKRGLIADYSKQYLSIEISANFISKEEALEILEKERQPYNLELMKIIEESIHSGELADF